MLSVGKVGMRVIIKASGRTYSGLVLSASNYAEYKGNGEYGDDDWYVEFTHDSDSAGPTGTYGYAKQKIDAVDSVEFEETV